ncbi:MAG TPA: hypothetical protein VMT15_16430 [Bryobacteraceae bacterium]|nr:hypothetical protein [Bryobacteraceae bacterium]
MKLLPDNIGGNPKQYTVLGVLAIALVFVYRMYNAQVATPAPPVPPVAPLRRPTVVARQQTVVPEAPSGPKLETRSGHRADDFRPSLKLPDGVDVTKIDPTLKLELLARLQKIPLEGGSRSVFDYGAPPVPPPPPVAPIKPGMIVVNGQQVPAGSVAPPAPVKPQAPPIPLKFYGYANRLSGAARQAFFLDGDDIQIKGENDVIRGRYKIIRIGINSAVVEDLQTHDQQTLPLVAELTS